MAGRDTVQKGPEPSALGDPCSQGGAESKQYDLLAGGNAVHRLLRSCYCVHSAEHTVESSVLWSHRRCHDECQQRIQGSWWKNWWK